jgi:hypothetical protein
VCLDKKKNKCTGMRTNNLEIIEFSDYSCKSDVATSKVNEQFINAREKECEKSFHVHHLKFFVKR